MIRREGGRPGFTLVEILVVVSIIVIMFGFAAPVIARFMSGKKVKAVTGRLARGLLSARMKAITKQLDVYAFFLHDRMVFISTRPEPPELFPYFADDVEKTKMTIAFRFADVLVKHAPNAPDLLASDLPSAAAVAQDWTKPLAAKTVLLGRVFEGVPVYLLFKSEGTVEFGSADGPGDILSVGFWATPPVDADIIVAEDSNDTHGWIDIRATGNVDTRIAEGAPDLRPRKETAKEG